MFTGDKKESMLIICLPASPRPLLVLVKKTYRFSRDWQTMPLETVLTSYFLFGCRPKNLFDARVFEVGATLVTKRNPEITHIIKPSEKKHRYYHGIFFFRKRLSKMAAM